MNFYEQPGNTAARRCNGAERSKWRDHGVDPELLTSDITPYEQPARQDTRPQVPADEAVFMGQKAVMAAFNGEV